MARYLTIWEPITGMWPADAAERIELGKNLIEQVKRDFGNGITKDWGAFLSGGGYTIAEGDGAEVRRLLLLYSQYFTFDVQEILPVEQISEILDSSSLAENVL